MYIVYYIYIGIVYKVFMKKALQNPNDIYILLFIIQSDDYHNVFISKKRTVNIDLNLFTRKPPKLVCTTVRNTKYNIIIL